LCGQFGVETDSNGLLYMRATYIPPIRRSINQDVLFGSVNPTGLAEAMAVEFAAQVVLIGLGKVAARMQNYPRK